MGFVINKNAYLSLVGIFALINIFVNLNSKIPDYSNYYRYYYGGEIYSDSLQGGYEKLSLYFFHHQYSFLDFRFAIGAITFFVLWIAMKFWTKNIAWVMGAYLIAYLPMDMIQIRNFMMLGFSALGIVILANKEGKLKYVFSIFFIGLGSQFHTLGLVFIPLIFMMLIPDGILDKLYKYVIIVGGIGLLILTVGSKVSFLSYLASAVGSLAGNEGQLTNKIINRYSTGTSMSMILAIVITNIAVWYSIGQILHDETSSLKNDKQKRIEKVMKNIGIYIIILSPMMLIAPDYSRIFRNFGFVSIVFFISVINQDVYSTKSKKIALMSLVILCISGILVWARNFGVLFMS